ncbi:outer membrane-stress sensor serine endopeptidase DegS [Enterobacillus tribolii]|uniref:Serine endoprotease DegS n=1 Tax=Enterobacillus tribolii TaxID=1487935 RepID=A0A370QQM6_9GAMM|nr:outer membrane-stress sensor serine endopeptidase DegS [Enterobacillus tribolii]MBW7981626.1 serine endoprotease DegS [Enterobacillus tribolii]RDK91005.1 serine protease DegS [Enterobacillus tribolii]
MLVKLLRSIIIGLIVAAILLVAVPSLRPAGFSFWRTASFEEVPLSYNQAVKRAAPAVVNIYTRSASEQDNNSLGFKTLGSGVIMDKRGYILTNLHVIRGASQIVVALQDGRVFEPMLVGSDPMTDLAVLKITANNLPVILINPERVAHIGDVVLAIGNPYNIGQSTTQGIISATGRIGLSGNGRQNFLQTDASINHGNSGGALVNSLGELMGINTLTLDKSNTGEVPEGLSFAIPTALATKIMGKLIRDGRVIRGFIGISGSEITPVYNAGNSIERIQGIIISDLTPGGPAANAGLRRGDIILSVDNKPAVNVMETMDQVAEIRPGTEIPVMIMRNGQRYKISVTIMEFPDSP